MSPQPTPRRTRGRSRTAGGEGDRPGARLVPHPDQVEINVRLDPKATIPETGVGAVAGPGRGEVSITLDDKSKVGLGRSLTTWVPASLARILFLNSRARYGPGYGVTLGDALVSEGLSDHFVAEAFPKTPPQPWDHRPMTSRREAALWHRATRDLIIPGCLRPRGMVPRHRKQRCPATLVRLHARIQNRQPLPRLGHSSVRRRQDRRGNRLRAIRTHARGDPLTAPQGFGPRRRARSRQRPSSPR